jgi:5-methyltetrahydrofolate--homocysteine methyltransferase
MPTTAEERVVNARLVVEAALERGLPLDRLHVDALVLPVAVDPDAGRAYLEAVTALRAAYGPEVRLTGGFSNVSFGLPSRRLLNDTFLGLAADAGADSGILDPLATDPARAFGVAFGGDRRKLAVALLTGEDAFGAKYLAAYRAGALT